MFNIFLILIFFRPFISSSAFIYANAAYSSTFLLFLLIWLWGKGLPLDKIRPLRYPLVLFIFALAISVAFSQNQINSFRELYKYISGILIFLFCACLARERKDKVVITLILAGLMVSLMAIYQYFFGFDWLTKYIAEHNISRPFITDLLSRKRVFFPFVTANTLAGYLIMIMFLVFSQWNNSRKAIFKPLSYALVVIFLALILTKSLGAFLSLFLASVIYLFLKGNLKRKNVVLLILLSLTLGAILAVRLATQTQHAHPLFSTIMRLNYWRETLNIIIAHPLTGIGLANFNIAQSRFAHNSYLQLWAETGILGIISFIWLIFQIVKSAIINLPNAINRRQAVGFVAAVLVFLIHNLVDFSFFLPEVSLIWWALLGLTNR